MLKRRYSTNFLGEGSLSKTSGKRLSGVSTLKHKKSAFTLTELLIALAVIGILVAIVFPFARQALPNSETMMAKRAFFATQNAVSSIINNYDCYPDKSRLLDLTQVRTGFGDGLGTSRCAKWPANSPEDAGTKFITMLTDQLDLDGDVTETSLGATFRTKDGMEWEVTHVNNFRANNNDKNAFAVLSVDVNGSNRGPNCGQYSEIACGSNRQDYDKFSMRVFEDGKLQILDCWAVDSVRSDKNISETEYRAMSNCAQLNETPPIPTRETDPPVPPGEDKCKFLPQPTDPTDECCDGGTHPDSPWIDTVYCDSCYPVGSTKAGVSCCAKWKANTSQYNTSNDEVKTYCCGNDEFYNSGDGAICPDCRGSNDTSLRCCSSSSRKSQITNKEDKCCSHSEIFNEVMACKPTVEPEPTTSTTPTNPTQPTTPSTCDANNPSYSCCKTKYGTFSRETQFKCCKNYGGYPEDGSDEIFCDNEVDIRMQGGYNYDESEDYADSEGYTYDTYENRYHISAWLDNDLFFRNAITLKLSIILWANSTTPVEFLKSWDSSLEYIPVQCPSSWGYSTYNHCYRAILETEPTKSAVGASTVDYNWVEQNPGTKWGDHHDPHILGAEYLEIYLGNYYSKEVFSRPGPGGSYDYDNITIPWLSILTPQEKAKWEQNRRNNP